MKTKLKRIRILSDKQFLFGLAKTVIVLWMVYWVYAYIGYKPSFGLFTGEYETLTFSTNYTQFLSKGTRQYSHKYTINYPGNWRVWIFGKIGFHFHEGQFERVRFISSLFQADTTIMIEQRYFEFPVTINELIYWENSQQSALIEIPPVLITDLIPHNGYYVREYQTDSHFVKEAYFVSGHSGVIIRLITNKNPQSQITEIFDIMVESLKIMENK